ncbi:MAG TPA: hypothetical protein VGN39_16975 [Terriglobales bacterium]|nr:hypothetical protein [Terriglobales bacterium]
MPHFRGRGWHTSLSVSTVPNICLLLADVGLFNSGSLAKPQHIRSLSVPSVPGPLRLDLNHSVAVASISTSGSDISKCTCSGIYQVSVYAEEKVLPSSL